jgi:hypothetical protein
MSRPTKARRLLRWYPAAWRERYADELVALIEDTFADGRIPWRTRFSTAGSGIVQRLRSSGLAPGAHEGPADQTRNGSLLVLWGWSFFVIAGSMYAKFNENWSAGTPHPSLAVPNGAYVAVEAAAAVGFLVVVLAGLIAFPTLVRAIRTSGWDLVRRPAIRVLTMGGATVIAGIPVVVWAHHLTDHQRNGGLVTYSAVFLTVALLIAATVVTAIGSAVSLVRQMDLTPTALTWLGRLALLAVLAMAIILGGTLTWWVALAHDAPGVLGGSAPVDLIVAGSLMAIGMAIAAIGAVRVTSALRHLRRN